MERRKFFTLQMSLTQFGMDCLLEELDIRLEYVRRNKETKEEYSLYLKSVDKILLKHSQTCHPDKAIGEKKSDQEIANAQNLQVALNATRKILQGLTKAFLEDIDIYYRYVFFAKMDISTLINEKEMDRQINNILCKISLISEVIRVNIVGEIRKFLQESRLCLRNFLTDDKEEFERHHIYAIRHLQKCIKGYSVLVTECELIVNECSGSTISAIQEIADQSRREMSILQNLEEKAEKSFDGSFQIYSFHEPEYKYEYFVSPFVLYINVIVMCTLVNRKLGKFNAIKELAKRVGSSSNTKNSAQFITEPTLFLKAYHLSFYFSNNKEHQREVEIILKRKGLHITNENILKEFKDAVEKIAVCLDEKFDINTYKEGKSNREQFTEKLFKLNESLSGYKQVEKELQEKLEQCRKETNEIRKGCFEFSENIQETESQCQENILKCKNTSEEMAKLISNCYQAEGTRSRNLCQAKVNENANCYDIKEDTTGTKRLEQYEKSAKNLLEFLIDYRQNVSKFTESQSSFSIENEYSLIKPEEFEKKIKASYELNKKINKQILFLMPQTLSETAKQCSAKQSSLEKSGVTNTNDEIGESSSNSDE